jgi:hypothetical protein
VRFVSRQRHADRGQHAAGFLLTIGGLGGAVPSASGLSGKTTILSPFRDRDRESIVAGSVEASTGKKLIRFCGDIAPRPCRSIHVIN